MALDVNCSRCKKPLDAPGAVVFSPPEPSLYGAEAFFVKCNKFHVCVECWPAVLEDLRHPKPQPTPRGMACKTCLGARVLCYRNMKAEPCAYPEGSHGCPNTGHHTCPECF